MGTLLQIIFINLVVSLDNIGVIAMATRGLSKRRAKAARDLGVWLSIFLKMIFVGIIGFLFRIPWLHIRILGGVMLLYVTFTMMKDSTAGSDKHEQTGQRDNFLFAIISIVAADVSMSFDNVLAILGVVSADGGGLHMREFLLIFGGLAFCVPILLWFSGTIAEWMDEYPVLNDICAGYLVYTAVKMMMEDEFVSVFLQEINFSIAAPCAALAGILVACFKVYSEGRDFKYHSGKILVACVTALSCYAVMDMAVLSYLSTGPSPKGYQLSQEALYGFLPKGINAVHLTSMSSGILELCVAVYTADVMRRREPSSFFWKYIKVENTMARLLLFQTALYVIGLTLNFGMGKPDVWMFILELLFEFLLMSVYAAVFGLLCFSFKSEGLGLGISLLFLLLEAVISSVLMLDETSVLAGMFPNYYLENLESHMHDMIFVMRGVFMSAVYILPALMIGERKNSRHFR